MQEIVDALQRIPAANFAKYRRLVEMLKPGGFLRWDPGNPSDRIVVFTERIETLQLLKQNLTLDLRLKPDQVGVLQGTDMSDAEIQDTV